MSLRAVSFLMRFMSCPTAVHVLGLVLACPDSPRIVCLKVYDHQVQVDDHVLCGCMPVQLSLRGSCSGVWAPGL